METDPSSHRNGQTATSDSGRDAPAKSAHPHKTDRFWSWLRAAMFLLVVIGFGAGGYLLRPATDSQLSVREPKITVLASQPNVTAMVNMTLSAKGSNYVLTLTLISVSTLTEPVKLAVWFYGFPQLAPGDSLIPYAKGYFATGTLPSGSSAAASEGQKFVVTSQQRIGEHANGLQFRVAFPELAGEEPGSQYSYQACGPGASIESSFATMCSGLRTQNTWYTPVLEADTTTLSSADPDLQGYQILAGDNPTLLGGDRWTWIGINGVTMLAANVSAEDGQQHDLFFSGVFFGVAAGALIAFFNELLRPVIWRKGKTSAQASSVHRS
jgi:hypothetical protein